MKKITKTSFGKKLAKYGALSLAIAGVADATGQVIYTDIDPDFVGGLGDSIGIDFDNDGTDDVTILQSNNGNYELVTANTAAPNGVVANSNGYLYASNLSYGASINSFNSFYSGSASFCAGVGYTGSAFCGLGEGYLGVKFEIAGATHYGWVRVDIADSSNFTVIDFAYESMAGETILAGDGVLGVNDNSFNNFSYYVDANNALNLKTDLQFENITIFSISGQQVINQKLSSNEGTISISNLQQGVYIARVSIEGNTKTFKIIKK
ncbi:MAG: hypothetical protein COB12_00950 [Flavobacterium sp.]|nr:MAG: hypothetical protein COB12_00950 [Flavobacterium sp.]